MNLIRFSGQFGGKKLQHLAVRKPGGTKVNENNLFHGKGEWKSMTGRRAGFMHG
ncbi:hypothetical protein ABGM91_03575 [Akkermansia muciniphila]|uniref:hypothetical protein n=1 Tax=Akkermansia muciniphila TaxID=239935 RepID=UPI0033BFAD47